VPKCNIKVYLTLLYHYCQRNSFFALLCGTLFVLRLLPQTPLKHKSNSVFGIR